MCNNVQHIPIVIPGSGPEGPLWIKTCNMVLCGVIFVSTALWARNVTISTQMTVVELVDEVRKRLSGIHDEDSDAELDKEKESFLEDEESAAASSGNSETELVKSKQADV